MRRLVGLLVVLGLLGLLGCGGDDDAERAVDDDASTSSTVERDPEGPRSQIDVLDDGAEPLVALRLRPEVGSAQPMVLRQEQDITVEMGGLSQHQPAPATELDIVYVVEDVSDGRVSLSADYTAGRVDAAPGDDQAIVSQLQQILDAFAASEPGRTVVDERGGVIEVDVPDVELPDAIAAFGDEMLAGFESQGAAFSFPLPEEPVGVGARWRVSNAATLTGIDFELESVVTVTSITEGLVDAAVELTMRFVPGRVSINGADVEVVSGTFTGGGTLRWDLHRAIAESAYDLTGESVMEVGGDTLRQRMSQRYTLANAG